MKKILILITALLILISLPSGASAKWWIFGKSAGGIRINYLYLNKISFDSSTDPEVTLYKDSLEMGNLVIKGRASVSNGSIGAVRVSMDNKKTWIPAKLASNGSFEYVFTPELEQVYDVFIKVMDTTGKTNDVEATYKKVQVVDKDMSSAVIATLRNLFQAYMDQDPARFMQFVSSRFETDETLLDTAIRKDFNTFAYIQIDYQINSIASGSRGRFYVSLNYNRSVASTNSGETFADYGLTEFIFAMEDSQPKLVRIKNPLLFGLSDASNIATGTINSGTTNPILVVDEYGNVTQKPFPDAIEIIESGNTFSSGGVQTGTITVAAGSNYIEGYVFTYDGMMPNELLAPAGANVRNLGGSDIDSVASVSVTGADMDFIMIAPAASQNSYAVRFTDGKYMLLQHTAGTQVGSTIKYRLQTDGTSGF